MAADSDGTLTAVVICEGNLHDPSFPRKFRSLLGKLRAILHQPKSKKLKVNKVEPWNSVRVTLSIPKDAASKLRQLASEGSSSLRALGILSVQLEGDTVISLRLVGQEIVLRTDNTTVGCTQEAGSSGSLSDLTRILASPLQTGTTSCSILAGANQTNEPTAGPSRTISHSPTSTNSLSSTEPIILNGPIFDKPQIFKSPNTVCPMDGKLPVPPVANVETREYPFESMTQARVIHRRENTMAVAAALGTNQQPQQQVVDSQNQAMLIGSQSPNITNQSATPLGIPGNPMLVAHHQTQEQSLKTQFVQPPPPPYPNVLTNHIKTAQPIQNQANTITIPVNQSVINPSNNIAISSPLLVNLLQNDGTSQAKQQQSTLTPPPQSPVLVQSTQSQNRQNLGSNIIKSPQQTEIILNAVSVNRHTQHENVILSGSQIVVNNGGVINSNNNGVSNISISPSIPVPSQISNINNINTNHSTQHISSSSITSGGIQVPNIANASCTGQISQSINIRMQQPPRFNLAQQHLLRQQSAVTHVGGTKVRFSQQTQQQILGSVGQQQFRHPIQQNSQQSYNTPSLPPHPSAIAISGTNSNVNIPSNPVILAQTQPQMLGTNFNHPRWPFKPMDSATKSSFQEFTRYQMQYNLQQQQMSQNSMSSNTLNSSNTNDKQASDPLGLVTLSELDELTKNDLESLLPSLNVNDLDTALGLDGKSALESLLDEKDLDLDLIDNESPLVPNSSTSISNPITDQQTKGNNSTNPENKTSSITEPALTSTGKQRQYLINPLTGDLEPMPSEESDTEPEIPSIDAFNELNSEMSNSLYSDDDNSCSTAFSKTSDHSDTERSSNSEASGRSRYSKIKKERRESSTTGSGTGSNTKRSKVGIKSSLLREKFHQSIKDKINAKTKIPRDKSAKAKLISANNEKEMPAEKIKLRLKLEKSEPITPAYKVDVSYVQSPKRVQSSAENITLPALLQTSTTNNSPSSSPTLFHQNNAITTSQSLQQSSASEELRVPPLHISLRGKNSIVIKNSKKDRKKSQSGGEEDETYSKKTLLKRNNSNIEDQFSNNCNNKILTDEFVGKIHTNFNNKISSQGKPSSKPSNEESNLGGTNKVASMHDHIFENGDIEDVISIKSTITNKRISPDNTHNPNGLLLYPDTKKRRVSQTLEQILQHQTQHVGEQIEYNHLKGPIGSTNVGTLPQHSSISKNQKGSNNGSNSIQNNYSIKPNKNLLKSGKPLVAVKNCKSPTSGTVKDPGKSPPHSSDDTVGLSSPSTQSMIAITTVNSTVTVNSNKSCNTCHLPQGSSDAITEEKFKQKLLEFQNHSDEQKDKSITVSNRSELNKEKSEINTLGDIISSSSIPPSFNKSTNLIDELEYSEKDNKTKISPMCSNNVSDGNNYDNSSAIEPQHSENNTTNTSKNGDKVNNNINNSSSNSISDIGPASLIHNPITNSANHNIRNSPGQGQGEDSGIESMDALSEKSPHQSASPQQGDAIKQPGIVHNKIDNSDKLSCLESKEINVDEITNIGDIEAALAKMDGIDEQFLTPCESPSRKYNGELEIKENCLLSNLTDEKIIICDSKIVDEDLNDLMLSPSEKANIEMCDVNENKEIISTKISLDTKLVDKCCKSNLSIKAEFIEHIKDETKLIESYEKNIIKSSCEDEDNKSDIKTELEEHNKTNKGNSSESIKSTDLMLNKEVLTPITIEIPTPNDTEAPRIRTRASSKLESPLDVLCKQSPQLLESPAINVKSNLRLSSTSIDKLSPKINLGKSLGTKRKRQGSESSTQSCVSDDTTPGKTTNCGGGSSFSGKRIRQNNNANNGNADTVTNISKMSFSNKKLTLESNNGINNSSAKINQIVKVKKLEESSDSDEPLIEVAGKVRNSKYTTTKHHPENEKVLRNHRITQIKATHSGISSPNILSTSKTIRVTTCTANNNNPTSIISINVACSGSQQNTKTNTNSTLDDKIGTRRSVRASAAANKIIYSKGVPQDSHKSLNVYKNTTSAVELVDVRRKTRSAAGVESSTDGRKRRGSRDGK